MTPTPPERQFRKKAVVIEAVQFTGDNATEIMIFVGKELSHSAPPSMAQLSSDFPNECWEIRIPTLEGVMTAIKGDWIIKGIQGEFYPCKPGIFDKTYQPAITPSKGREEAAREWAEKQRVEEDRNVIGRFRYNPETGEEGLIFPNDPSYWDSEDKPVIDNFLAGWDAGSAAGRGWVRVDQSLPLIERGIPDGDPHLFLVPVYNNKTKKSYWDIILGYLDPERYNFIESLDDGDCGWMTEDIAYYRKIGALPPLPAPPDVTDTNVGDMPTNNPEQVK